MRPLAVSAASFALFASGCFLASVTPAKPVSGSIHDFTVKTIGGGERTLSEYAGKAVLVVNVASKCGYTPQYEGLEALWKEYQPKGLVVLGFPSNDFMGQEPGTEEEIATFCRVNYGVTFPLFAKGPVKGDEASPLYRYLASAAGEPRWNFYKYLVGKDGKVVSVFSSGVKPDSPELRKAIDEELAK
ncbi:MAG: glutathione peroxidase [Myxococcales bacterium]